LGNLFAEESGRQAAAAARLSEAARNIGTSRLEIAGAVEGFTELCPAIATGIVTFELVNPLPLVLEAKAKEELETLGREAASALNQAKSSLANAKKIRLQMPRRFDCRWMLYRNRGTVRKRNTKQNSAPNRDESKSIMQPNLLCNKKSQH
jgi:hypothetical protein